MRVATAAILALSLAALRPAWADDSPNRESTARAIQRHRNVVAHYQALRTPNEPESLYAVRRVAELYESLAIYDLAVEWWARLGTSPAPDADLALERAMTLSFLVDRPHDAVAYARTLLERYRRDMPARAELSVEIARGLHRSGYDGEALRMLARARLGGPDVPPYVTARARELDSEIRMPAAPPARAVSELVPALRVHVDPMPLAPLRTGNR